MKTLDYNVEEVLHSLKTIKSDNELTAEFRKKYGTDFAIASACIKGDVIKPQAVNLITKLAPICYKIGDKVFLKGETKGDHDFVGDGFGQEVTELFDMTTEMKSGHSYSFYVSSTGYFELASSSEIIEVKKFLSNLK